MDALGSRLAEWVAGGILTDAEVTAIGELMPSARRVARAVSSGAKVHGNAHYAALYGVSDRAIKQWLALGREGGVMPPLDKPEAMAIWYHATHDGRKPPGKLLELQLVEQEAKPAADAPAVIHGDFTFGHAVAMAARHLEYLGKQMQLARDQNNFERVVALNSALTAAQETYRKAKKDEHDHLLLEGKLVDRAVVFAEMRLMLSEVAASIRSIAVRAATKLSLSAEATRELSRCLNQEVDRLFESAQRNNGSMREPLELAA